MPDFNVVANVDIETEIYLDDYEVFERYTITEIVEWFGAESLLDEIEKEKAMEHFNLTDYEDKEI
jgi:hypothetical protein